MIVEVYKEAFYRRHYCRAVSLPVAYRIAGEQVPCELLPSIIDGSLSTHVPGLAREGAKAPSFYESVPLKRRSLLSFPAGFLVCVVVSFVVAFATMDFWVRTGTYLEQPQVAANADVIATVVVS